MRELHVECLPNAIPDTIEVDITNLGAHQQVRISDLQLPEGVKVEEDPHRVIVGVTTARAEGVAEGATPEAVVAESEVFKKGKTETEKQRSIFRNSLTIAPRGNAGR